MDLPFPQKGLSDLGPASRQERGTTTRGTNVRLLDPWTNRLTGSQRSGLDEYGNGSSSRTFVPRVVVPRS